MKRTYIALIIALTLTAGFVSAAQERNEISFSYGGVTMYDIAYGVGGAIYASFTGGSSYYDNIRGTGSVAIEYQRRLGEKGSFTIGATVMYTGDTFDLYRNENEEKTYCGKADYDAYIIMPSAKAYWFQKKNFAMYSRVAAGVSYLKGKETNTEETTNHNDIGLAVQITPVALEFGGKFRGFIELGAGMQGIAAVGLRYRF